jgi:hypothetical protein
MQSATFWHNVYMHCITLQFTYYYDYRTIYYIANIERIDQHFTFIVLPGSIWNRRKLDYKGPAAAIEIGHRKRRGREKPRRKAICAPLRSIRSYCYEHMCTVFALKF